MDKWLGVELRHLTALEAIAAEGSFRGAADRLGYVQSAVSQQLSALERLVGARLVERSRGHSTVRLTEAGEVLRQHAERIVAEVSAARADMYAMSDSGAGRVRLGAFQSVAARVLPPILAKLAGDHPDIQVATTETSGDGELFDAVARGDLDCAFAELPLDIGPFEAVELMVDPTVLVVHADSPLAMRETPPTIAELATLPLAYPNWRMKDLIGHHFRAAGLHAPESVNLETNAAVQGLVATGLAAAIMPRLAVDPDAPGTRTIDLTGVLPARTLVLYWHRDRVRHPALSTFVAVTTRICRQLTAASDDMTSRRFAREDDVATPRPAPTHRLQGSYGLPIAAAVVAD